jgi:hypothetical protein|tara:strand:- start:129 stop:512 length:384 start_codon:yes stop_codon:yes gene_type:complete
MITEKYTNRYGDKFLYTLQEDGNIMWTGKFEHCRIGMPNDYSKAWEYFNEVYGGLSFEDFKKDVHSYDEEKEAYVFPDVVPLITSKTDEISMVDPSGGPYLTSGMKLMEKTIKEFKYTENGYLIITE